MTTFSWGDDIFLAHEIAVNQVAYTSQASLCSPPNEKPPTIKLTISPVMDFTQFASK